MPRTSTEKLRDALKMFALTPGDRRYLRMLRQSAAFDRDFYLASNPRLHPLFRRFPERHYLCEGEAMGLCPNPGFSPYAYLARNPDLVGRGIRPLEHWIDTGRAEGRPGLSDPDDTPPPEMPGIDASDRPDPPAPVAVALHLYYPELWKEFAARLATQRFAFDLFVTLTGPAALDPDLAGRIVSAHPGARVWTLPNRGRDILPFAHLAGSGLLQPYAAVCKLHGKKSPHRRDGDDWRGILLDGVLGAPEATATRLDAFLADPAAGIWCAQAHLCRGAEWWGGNREIAEVLLARIGMDTAAELHFPAGSIYWTKPAVIDRLKALRLGPADFGPEYGLVDGTPAHAVERSMGYLAAAAGLELVSDATLDQAVAHAGHFCPDQS